MSDICVSILCITYNHEKYIEDAIKGFLMQETTFEVEILIGDDCSTDNTRQIVENYVAEYPNRIKLFNPPKNMGAKANAMGLFSAAQGKYIAICEGDDYWTDPNKLQLQVDYMEAHEACSFTFHATQYVDGETGEPGIVRRSYDHDCISPIEDIITGGGGFCPSASIVHRKSAWLPMPESYLENPIGDYPKQMTLASRGTVYYFNRVMAVYRYRHAGSWTTNSKNTQDKKVEHHQSMIALLNKINAETKQRYDGVIQETVKTHAFSIALYTNNFKELRKKEYRNIFNKMSLQKRIKTYLQCLFPGAYKRYKVWDQEKL